MTIAREILNTSMEHYAIDVKILARMKDDGAAPDLIARAEALVLNCEVMLISAVSIYLNDLSQGARGPALRPGKPAHQ